MHRLHLLAFYLILHCHCATSGDSPTVTTSTDLRIAGAMRNVMWKGELGPSIALDSLHDRPGLYAVGPLTGLQGEITILDGESYVSRVGADGNALVERTFEVGAPFLVYAQVTAWDTIALPAVYRGIAGLETLVDSLTQSARRPFAFKVSGAIASARIHIQNHPDGATITSPDEAHAGQVKYDLADEMVDIVGFFSTEHQGVFTHHDTYLHLHLVTRDRRSMGHLERVEWGEGVKVLLPRPGE